MPPIGLLALFAIWLKSVTIPRSTLAWHLAFGTLAWYLASGIWGHMTVVRNEAKGSCTPGNLEC
jgi:hypothetical protein